jgi:hypothetical protein
VQIVGGTFGILVLVSHVGLLFFTPGFGIVPPSCNASWEARSA